MIRAQASQHIPTALFVLMLFTISACTSTPILPNPAIDEPNAPLSLLTTTTTEDAELLGVNGAEFDRFGFAVSIYEDTAVIGVLGDDDGGSATGSVYVFTRSGTTWTRRAKLLASDPAGIDFFGV